MILLVPLTKSLTLTLGLRIIPIGRGHEPTFMASISSCTSSWEISATSFSRQISGHQVELRQGPGVRNHGSGYGYGYGQGYETSGHHLSLSSGDSAKPVICGPAGTGGRVAAYP